MAEGSLSEKIKSEMVVDYANALEKSYELAKQFIKITSTGTIDLIGKDDFKGVEKIQLYFIGKWYAKEAGLADSEYVPNAELCTELGLKEGTVKPAVKSLRDLGVVETKGGKSAIKSNYIEIILKKLLKKNG